VPATLAVLAVLITACSQSSTPPPSTRPAPPPTTGPPNISTTTSTTPVTPVTWLCRPGLADNPCLSSLATTVVTGRRATRVVQTKDTSHPKIDCFYVYPTVSTQPTANANLTIDPQETAVAMAQASRFSQVCNVYAPMYRQLTVAGIEGTGSGAPSVDLAYGDVLAAWKDYLAHYNRGRGVAFIGHSQGSAMLIRLLKTQVDADPAERSRLVSAILPGGNVTVPIGKKVGGTFAHIPLCTNVELPGCVIAYSSFSQTPPQNSLFGRVDSAVDVLSGEHPGPGEETACVNPVAGIGPAPGGTAGGTAARTTAVPTTTKPRRPAKRATATTTTADPTRSTGPGPTSVGTSGALLPYFPVSTILGGGASATAAANPVMKSVTTPWVSFPRMYLAQCMSGEGATWLMVEDVARPGDKRPAVSETLGPTWGLHLVDINIALGNLVSDVQQQARSYPS
jgi:hypothetical protein